MKFTQIIAIWAKIYKFSPIFESICYFTSISNSINTSGIVPTLKICDISAIDDPVEVSRSYAFGMTIVLSPSGIAIKQTIQVATPSGTNGMNIITSTASTGRRSRRTNEMN